MIGINAVPSDPKRVRENDGLSTNGGGESSLYLQLSEDAPVRCTAIIGDKGLQSHQYHSAYEVDPQRVAAGRELRTLYVVRRDLYRLLHQQAKAEKRRLLAEFRASCYYSVPRFYYRKVVELRTRPVYALRGVYVPYRVTRRKLVRKIPYKRKVVWYTTIVLHRHRGLVRKKRRHEKVVTLYRRVWKIWTEVHKRKFGKEKYLVRIKTYTVGHRIKTALPPRQVFDRERFMEYLTYQVGKDIQNSPSYQSTLERIRTVDGKIASILLKIRGMMFRNNRCRFWPTTTLLEATTQQLQREHRFTATYGSVKLPTAVGPECLPFPDVHKYSRVAGHKQFYGMRAVLRSSGTVVAEGFPGRDDNPTSFFIRGFAGTSTSVRISQDELSELYPLVHTPTYDINDPLMHANVRGAMWSATQAMLNGRVAGPQDPIVLTRSVGELKDVEQTISTVRDAITWAHAQDTSSVAYKRLTALEAKWARSSASARDIAMLRKFTKTTSLPRGTIVYAAGLYCCYRFALEPTVQDILTVVENWREALFGLRNNLAKMLRELDDPHVDSIVLKKYYRPVLEPLEIKPPSLPPNRSEDWEFTFSGPDTTGSNTDTYDLYLNSSLIKSVDRNSVVYTATPTEYLNDLSSKGVVATYYHELRDGLVYTHVSGEDLFAMIGEDIRTWRDALSQTLERAKFLETIWELIPLSFIINWFFTTRKSVENLHNLVMTWYTGTYSYKESVWATQAVRRLTTRSLASLLSLGVEDPVFADPIDIYVSDRISEKEHGEYYLWRTLYRTCRMSVSSREYFPQALIADNTFKTRFFYRGEYYVSEDTLGAMNSLVPIPKVHLNLGKLASMLAILAGCLAGRKR